MFLSRSKAAQLDSSEAVSVARTAWRTTVMIFIDVTFTKVDKRLELPGLVVRLLSGFIRCRRQIGGEPRRTGGDDDAAGPDDDALHGALGLFVEHGDDVAFGAAFGRLAAHRQGDARHFVDQLSLIHISEPTR